VFALAESFANLPGVDEENAVCSASKKLKENLDDNKNLSLGSPLNLLRTFACSLR
jgi:hypothetical protein